MKNNTNNTNNIKSFTISGTTWTITDKLMTRMEERGMDEYDVKCALKYGQKFASFNDRNATLTIDAIDEADYDGQMTNYGRPATHVVLVHKKNAFGPGRAILDAYFGDVNRGEVRYNMSK